MNRPNKITFTAPKDEYQDIVNLIVHYVQYFESYDLKAEYIIIHQKLYYKMLNSRHDFGYNGFTKIEPDGSVRIMDKKLIRTCDIDEDTIMII